MQESLDWDPRTAEVTMGTSVGSLLALLLRAGVGTSDLVADQYGEPTNGPLDGSGFDHDTALRAVFAWSKPPLGSPRLLMHALVNPSQCSPMTLLAALCPMGNGSLTAIRSLVGHVVPSGEWPSGVHVVATNYDTGRRRLFSPVQDGVIDVADAVAASCSVPGFFPPVVLQGQRFVDGSVSSVTNVDLLAEHDLDEVYVLTPMVPRPHPFTGWIQYAASTIFRRALAQEVRELRATGAAVTVLAPGPEDLHAMGTDLMDTSRRTGVLDTALRSTRARLVSGEL